MYCIQIVRIITNYKINLQILKMIIITKVCMIQTKHKDLIMETLQNYVIHTCRYIDVNYLRNGSIKRLSNITT